MADTHTDWLTASSEHPSFRIRANVGRTATAVVWDSTIEMTWAGTPATYYVDGEERSVDAALDELSTRLMANIVSRVHEARNVDTYVPKREKAA